MDFNLNEVESENKGWKPLKAGVEVPAVLESVEFGKQNDEETEDLVFNFKGTADGNRGTFNFRVWANTFDKNDQYFDETKSNRVLAQIKHIVRAYLPEEVASKIVGSSWKEFASNVIKALNKNVIGRPCALKVVLDNKNRVIFPLFPDFITTDLTPDRVLSLNSKINPRTNLPYERIEFIEFIDVASAKPADFADMDFKETPADDAGDLPEPKDDLPF